MQSHETAGRMILRKLNEMVFGVGPVATVVGALFAVLWAVAAVLQWTSPDSFLLPNGLELRNPTFSLDRVDVFGSEGRILRLPQNDWACFDDRTLYLGGRGGGFAVDADGGRVLSVRRPADADRRLCGEAGYFDGSTGHNLFLGGSFGLPCEMLNRDLDRFAQAQRFRDICRFETPAPATVADRPDPP